MLKVISFNICPFVQRVTALLEAKNIAYEIEYISLKDKPQWFLDISPNGQVPVLVIDKGDDNRQALFESDAIVEYIEEAYPRLGLDVTVEQRAIDRAWSYLASKNYLVQCSAQRSANEATLKERSLKLDKAFTAVEKILGDTPFFNTQSVGMVDIAWLPLLHRAAIIEQYSGYDFLQGYPKVKRWQETLLHSELAEKSVSATFIDAFTRFYLSEDTFLGRSIGCSSENAFGSEEGACSNQADTACATANCC